MTTGGGLELSVAAPGVAPVRVALTRGLTAIGSAPDADLRIAGVPAQWLLVRRDGARVVVAVIATGRRLPLEDRPLVVDGITLALVAGGAAADTGAIPVGAIAAALAEAEHPSAALAALLDAVLAAADADTGAIVMRQDGGHAVVAARDRAGNVIRDGAAVLSDTVLHEVLATGRPIAVDDTAIDPRLAGVQSVVDLALRSVIAIPMLLGDRTVGALYLGTHGAARRFGAPLAAELAVVASMALPAIAQLRRAGAPRAGSLVGAAPVIAALRGLIERVAPTDLSVLIAGETGTGKEVVAQALHAASARAARPMIAVNCAAIPANLFEAELFGHKRGAFTGAVADRAGRLEAADGSTLFLDEIGELPLPLQAALLRAIQEREVVRVGESAPRKVDFRLICATNKDLDAEVEGGRFRADLLFRLREVTAELPPLRERGGDVELLAAVLLADAEAQLGTPRHALAPDALAALRAHDWPGNVRELRAVMRRAAVLADGATVTARDLALPAPRRRTTTAPPPPAPPPAPAPAAPPDLGSVDRPLAIARDQFVAAYCTAALARHNGNREAAAAALGISTRSLHRYLRGEPD
jgi:transcriptional regulator with GAF, ATPase, and Fis domain